MRRATFAACLLAALSVSASAFAQDEKAEAPEEAKTDAPEGEGTADAGAKAKPAKSEASDDEGDDAASDEDKDGVRFRGGFLAPTIGPAFGSNSTSGAMVGLFKLQLGAQINHYLGVMYDGGPIVAAVAGDSVGAGFFIQNSALAVLSLGKIVYFDVGAGPSLDVYLFGEADANSASVGSGAAPGIATKVALGFGGGPDAENARRVAFKLSVDPHFTFLPGGSTLIYIPIGIGVEWF